MKPKLILRTIMYVLVFIVCIALLEKHRKANLANSLRSGKYNNKKVNGMEAGSTDFIFFESFSRYLLIPLAKK